MRKPFIAAVLVVSSALAVAARAQTPAPTASAPPTGPMDPLSDWNARMSRTAEPRTKFGTVVVAVARRLVPNCSEPIVTNTAQ